MKQVFLSENPVASIFYVDFDPFKTTRFDTNHKNAITSQSKKLGYSLEVKVYMSS